MIEAKTLQKLRIVIYAAGMPFDGDTVKTASLGGSESAAYYMGKELASRGHNVVCFTSKQGQAKTVDGVTYLFHGEMSQNTPLGQAFEHYAMSAPCDLLLIQRVPFAFHRQFNAKVCIWQLHDLALYRLSHQIINGTWQIDATTVVSQWHADQVKKVYNLNPEFVKVVPNGVDGALYTTAPKGIAIVKVAEGPYGKTADEVGVLVKLPAEKFLLLYQSRPERGLENALDLMQKAEAIGLPVHLAVCGYDNTTSQMASYYNMLYSRAAGMKNVTLLGALSKPHLAHLQQNCDLLLYPTKFEEVSCITAMEAMHANLPMLSSDCAALGETCKGSGTILLPLKDNEVDLEAFDKKLQDLFGLIVPGQYPEELQKLRELQADAKGSRTWGVATDALLNVYAEAIGRRTHNLDAVVRNAIEHSDIAFAKHVMEIADKKRVTAWGGKTEEVIEQMKLSESPIMEASRKELLELYAFAQSPEKYAAHYLKHQTAYYDEFEDKVIGEDVTQTTRYIGVQSLVAEHVMRLKRPIRVLDYGCAHGHYTMRLAKAFPECEFVGLDISERAVKAAKKWADKDEQQNTFFIQGSQDKLQDETLGEFDLVLAGEVLEHVWDYSQLLDRFRERLAPDGAIVITTPLGRWEHSGTVPFRYAREHLHHFDRADIEEICAGHDYEILHAPAGQDRSGHALGSWVWCVRPKPGLPLWKVDYNRKLLNYAGRQTISACLIVKDGEKTLRRCVESFVDWVDQIVIAVDPTTTDRTYEIFDNLERDFPYRSFKLIDGKEALKDGFAAARNESIKYADGQWILWIDADEELRFPWAMHKLCRPSQHGGFGFPQVHYSVDPDQVLTADYPCRLFRNNIGGKFFGLVHEHPETELGKAMPWSLVRPEMKFLHHGYFDEETRRARFERNLPLLMREVAEQPDRALNRFLHLRDVAQGIKFEQERFGGRVLAHHMDRAMLGIQIMEGIIAEPSSHARMISDAMQYYSMCVATLNTGFDANISIQVRHPQAPDLAANIGIQGRFHNREFYEKLVNKLNQESTKLYEERYF